MDFFSFIAPQVAELLRAIADYLDVEEDGDDPAEAGVHLVDDTPPRPLYRINERGGVEQVSAI